MHRDVPSGVVVASTETFAIRAALATPFHWATGTAHERRTTLVRIVTTSGFEGWAELLRGDIAGAIEIATWDAVAREAGRPLAAMIATNPAPAVPVYASGVYYDDGDPSAEARGYFARGHTRVKMKIGRLSIADDLARIRAVREAIGDVELMVDANGAYDLAAATTMAEALRELDVRWLEEPFPLADVTAYRELHRRRIVAIAAGESLDAATLHEFLSPPIVDVIQPNVATCGGVAATLNVLRSALANGVRPAIHAWGTPVMTAVSLHVAAAIGESTIVEIDRTPNPLRAIASDFDVRDGAMNLREAPGLGIDVDLAAVERMRIRSVA